MYKIKYSINMMPIVAEHIEKYEVEENKYEETIEFEGVSLSNLFIDSDELEIFDTPCIQEVIQYKWDTYGMRFHIFGFIMHLVYVVIINIYVANSYMRENTMEVARLYVILLMVGIFYPWLYDFTQLIRGGLSDYLSDPWNYADMLYIYGSIINCIL